jgi:hypothetical protein
MDLNQLPQVITAVGGLGTAAFGLVDASKAVLPINRIGFGRIRDAVAGLTSNAATNSLSQPKILDTLEADWCNGTDIASQKAIAKSLIKLNFSTTNAAQIAAATGIDSATLGDIAKSIAAGTPLNSQQGDLYARFDLIVTALLDEAYQYSDQVYRNWTRALAAIVAVALAIVGGLTLKMGILPSILVGLLATPLAPIAKDVSSALAAAVNTMQAVKKAS